MSEFHEWRVEAGATAGYCEMSLCGRPRGYRAIYTFQTEEMRLPDVRAWAVCALHAKLWAEEKDASVPVDGIVIAPELVTRALTT